MATKKKKPEVKPEVKPSLVQQEGHKPSKKIIGDASELDLLIPDRSFHSTWSSPEALARYIKSKNKEDAWHKGGWVNNEDFSGSKSMDKTLDMAINGWKAGADKVEKLRSRIQSERPVIRQPVRYNIVGAIPNVPRAVSGNILNMKDIDITRAKRRPVLTILYDMACNCSVKADTITNCSAAVAALIDRVEQEGYSVEVIATALTSGGGWDWTTGTERELGYSAATSIRVKESHQPTDTMRLAFALGHASLFRRMIFADWGLEPGAQGGLGQGLGTTGVNSRSKEDLNDRHIYVLPSAEKNQKYFKDEEAAMTFGLDSLIRELQEQKCPPFLNSKLLYVKEKDEEKTLNIPI